MVDVDGEWKEEGVTGERVNGEWRLKMEGGGSEGGGSDGGMEK